MRIGIGYDIHRFNRKPPLKLGGVTIPFDRGLSGHSDADVLLHALADALFGAIAAPDIGEQFPPGQARTRNMNSRLFVKAALAQVAKAGWRIGNVDTVIIADAPKLSLYKAKIAGAISRLLGVPSSCVGIKAKTTEGFEPKEGGIAAQAVVLLLPAKKKMRKL